MENTHICKVEVEDYCVGQDKYENMVMSARFAGFGMNYKEGKIYSNNF